MVPTWASFSAAVVVAPPSFESHATMCGYNTSVDTGSELDMLPAREREREIEGSPTSTTVKNFCD